MCVTSTREPSYKFERGAVRICRPEFRISGRTRGHGYSIARGKHAFGSHRLRRAITIAGLPRCRTEGYGRGSTQKFGQVGYRRIGQAKLPESEPLELVAGTDS